jgi:hypothetical protein
MTEWSKAMWTMLQGREAIRPDDLPRFGSVLRTNSGHSLEVVAWYGPNPNEGTAHAQERVAFGFVFDGVAPPDMPQGAMLLGYAPESAIVHSQEQRFPRFDKWLASLILTGKGE